MECVTPVTIRAPSRGFLHVPCGSCAECLTNKRSEWSFRIRQEYKYSSSAKFITLTYSDENLTYGLDPSLNKREIQLFLKRLRKKLKSDGHKPFRYYIVGEYGSKYGRPHYHGIFFNLPYCRKVTSEEVKLRRLFMDAWQMGNVDIGDVNDASIHYTTKYIVGKSENQEVGRSPTWSIMSLRPAIGHNYLNRGYEYHKKTKQFFTKTGGFTQNLPRYYRDKIFNLSEKIENTDRQIAQKDKKNNEVDNELQQQGENLALYKLEKRKQFLDKVKRSLKKGKL